MDSRALSYPWIISFLFIPEILKICLNLYLYSIQNGVFMPALILTENPASKQKIN